MSDARDAGRPLKDPLPIDEVLPQLIAELRENHNVVLQAPTGAGKTTRVPPAIVDANIGGRRQVVLLEPRRLAAVTAARRIAFERKAKVGGEVGYHVRFDRSSSRETRIMAVTEGILLRYLQDDPFLDDIGVVVFDEFHERNLASDLALAMLRRVQREFRPDLKLVVMSATLDTKPLTRFLECDVVVSEGRQFPIDIQYLQPLEVVGGSILAGGIESPLVPMAANAIRRALAVGSGHVLVFLPGLREIRQVKREVEADVRQSGGIVFELYGDLPIEKQEDVLRRSDQRKVILATNVAETSLTIEGVSTVVDSGLARVLRYDTSVGLNRLELSRISKVSAAQRGGRAGRTGPGICLRLWTESEQRTLRDAETPEVQRVDLAEAILQLHGWGESHPAAFPWFQVPNPTAIEQANRLLELLGATLDGQITSMGKRMVRLPLHPRLARLLCAAKELGCLADAALVAAMMSERDPFSFQAKRGGSMFADANQRTNSEVADRIEMLREFERDHGRDLKSRSLPIDPNVARNVFRIRDQLVRTMTEFDTEVTERTRRGDTTALPRALLAAFPDRVVRRRDTASRRGVMVGGRGVELARSSRLQDGELMLCIDVEEQSKGEALVRQALLVSPDWLREEHLSTAIEYEFDEERERVLTFRRTRYLDLMIDESTGDSGATDKVTDLLVAAAAAKLDRALDLSDEAVASFIARVRCLGSWMPELQLPTIDASQLAGLLPSICPGCRSFAELRKKPILDWIRGLFTSAQLSALEREAPDRITVPNGKRFRIEYAEGRPPVLAIRIQDAFGMLETPRIAGGRVPLLMHLLAPNMRPQQVTDDLKSFWDRGYPVIRKELRARYPKHAWPEKGG